MSKNNNVKLGILGGVGPESSALFYSMVVRHTLVSKDQDHIDMIIYNHATIPDRTSMISNGRIDVLKELLITDAKALESFGADCLIITCNTSHVVADEIQAKISIPLINMPREAVAECSALYSRETAKIAVLATDGTIGSSLYQNELGKAGIESYIPCAKNQALVMKLIYAVKAGIEIDISDLAIVEEELRKEDCRAAILGCTELSILKNRYDLPEFYIDAMGVLVKRAIEFAGKEYKWNIKH
jgi:aspartate racemase